MITTKVKAKKRKTSKKPIGTCFILMPFKEPFDTYYNLIIEPAVTKAKLKALRGDSLFLPRPIMADIWEMIQGAKVVLAELTGKNTNVFYELGLGHAIGKPIVLISETMDDVPFDLQALRVILYNKDDPKWGDKLRNDIVSALEATLSEPIKAVPTMFRKKVKSQAPAESESSSRLAALERKIASIERRSSLIEDERERRPGPSEATSMIVQYLREGMPKEIIIRRLERLGVPGSFVREKIKDIEPSLF